MSMGGSGRVTAARGWLNKEGVSAAGAPEGSANTEDGLGVLPRPVAKEAPGTEDAKPARWPPSRIASVEALWGEGFIMPGGGPETMRLAKPLGLTSNATLLLLGSGLGGPAHAICNAFGAWVTSLEADPDLFAASVARRPPLDPRNRITMGAWDRDNPAFRPRSANHALALEALRGSKPGPVLDSLAAALRPQGQIVLTELVSETPPSDKDREFAAWCRLENRLPLLPRSDEVTEALRLLRFDVRVVEDMSDRHIAQTLGGWREAVRAMAAGPRPAAHTAAAFVTEAELWLLRIRLMRRLGVRLMRWHAIGSS